MQVMLPRNARDPARPGRTATAFLERRRDVRQITPPHLQAQPPVLRPLGIKVRGIEVHHHALNRHLSVAVAHAFAGGTIHVVAAKIQTALRPAVDFMNPVEQRIGTGERPRVGQRALDQQGDRVLLRRRAVETFDDHVAESGVVEPVAEHLTGLPAGHELAGLPVGLIGIVAAADTGKIHAALPADGDVADRRSLHAVGKQAVGKMHPHQPSGGKSGHLQLQPAGQVAAEINLVSALCQWRDRDGGDLLADPVGRRGVPDARPGRRSGFRAPASTRRGQAPALPNRQ